MASLADVNGSIPLLGSGGFWRKLGAFAGPGYLVAVGYMDPGNWATDIAGGSAFGYTLLSVILLSSLMAMVLLALSARLGIATGLDLAQACRAHYPRPVSAGLWVLCEIAICACDLAEVLGTAIALKLLFGLPLLLGVVITTLDVLLLLALQRAGFRLLEAFVIALLVLIAGCFALEIAFAQPALQSIAAGFIPTPEVVLDPAMLYIAIGILGATVMPHNLYLHSSIVQTRHIAPTAPAKRSAMRFATTDCVIALTFAFAVNAAILILAADAFHSSGNVEVASIEEAHRLLAPALGVPLAGAVFAVALLLSGQNATLTATLAGQIVMEGFVRLTMRPWVRRLATRLIAIIPAVCVIAFAGEGATAKLLVLSQVVLSLQLPFAVIPLVQFTSSRKTMGEFVSPPCLKVAAIAVAAAVTLLNVKLVSDFLL